MPSADPRYFAWKSRRNRLREELAVADEVGVDRHPAQCRRRGCAQSARGRPVAPARGAPAQSSRPAAPASPSLAPTRPGERWNTVAPAQGVHRRRICAVDVPVSEKLAVTGGHVSRGALVGSRPTLAPHRRRGGDSLLSTVRLTASRAARRAAAGPVTGLRPAFQPDGAVASSQRANGVPLPSTPVSTAVAIIALPAASVAIWALLRSPVAPDGSSRCRRPTAGTTSPTPIVGGIGIFAGFSVGLWAAVGGRRVLRPTGRSSASTPAVALVFLAGLADDLFSLRPIAKLAAQGGAAAIVLVTGTHVQLVHNPIIGDAIAVVWLIGVANAFNLLDNMDGLAATPRRDRVRVLRDRRRHRPSGRRVARVRARRRARVRRASSRSTCARSGRALVFMGDSGSQALGFALAALGLTSSWRVAGTTVATLILPILVLAVPILDTALVTVARLLDGRPIYQGGRDHSSHRLVRFGLSEKHAVALLALIAICIGGSSLAYNVLDNYRYTIVGVVLTFALLIQFASFLADVERRPVQVGEPVGLAQAFAVHWRRVVEVVVDFGVITASFMARLRDRVRLAGIDEPAVHPRPDAAGHPLGAVSRLHPVRALPLGLALRRRPRRGSRSRSPSSCPRSSRSRSWC